MNASRRTLAEIHRGFARIAAEAAQLRRALSRRDRLLAGLSHALRAALAATLGYYGALALGLEQGFWAAITAISVTQNNYAEVRNSSRDQFIGAAIGGLVGMTAATPAPGHFLPYILALLVGMTLCWMLDLGAAGRIAGVTTTIIMLVPHHGTFWQFALFRLGEVMLGAVSALLVTWLGNRLERRLAGTPTA